MTGMQLTVGLLFLSSRSAAKLLKVLLFRTFLQQANHLSQSNILIIASARDGDSGQRDQSAELGDLRTLMPYWKHT